MADYLSVRFKIRLKSEYIQPMDLVTKETGWELSEVELFREFGELPRSDNLMGTVLSYPPKGWEESVESFLTFPAVSEDGVWSSIFSIVERHENTWEEFMENVLPEITKEIIYLEVYCESEKVSRIYKMEKGKPVVLARVDYNTQKYIINWEDFKYEN